MWKSLFLERLKGTINCMFVAIDCMDEFLGSCMNLWKNTHSQSIDSLWKSIITFQISKFYLQNEEAVDCFMQSIDYNLEFFIFALVWPFLCNSWLMYSYEWCISCLKSYFIVWNILVVNHIEIVWTRLKILIDHKNIYVYYDAKWCPSVI